MLTTDERAALVEELTQAQHDAWPGVDADFIVNTEAIMPILDRLLADRAAPTVDDAERVERAVAAMAAYLHQSDPPVTVIGVNFYGMARAALEAAGAAPGLDVAVRRLIDEDLPGRTIGICLNEGKWYVQQMYTGLEESYPTDVSGHGDTIADAVAKAGKGSGE